MIISITAFLLWSYPLTLGVHDSEAYGIDLFYATILWLALIGFVSISEFEKPNHTVDCNAILAASKSIWYGLIFYRLYLYYQYFMHNKRHCYLKAFGVSLIVASVFFAAKMQQLGGFESAEWAYLQRVPRWSYLATQLFLTFGGSNATITVDGKVMGWKAIHTELQASSAPVP